MLCQGWQELRLILEPSFRTSAWARLLVIRFPYGQRARCRKWQVTRSLISVTAVSGRPTTRFVQPMGICLKEPGGIVTEKVPGPDVVAERVCHDGNLFMAPAPNRFHQDISRTIQFEMMKYLEVQPVGIVYDAPFDVVSYWHQRVST